MTGLDLPPSLVRLLGNLPGSVSLAGEGPGGQVPQSRMGSIVVVGTPPFLNPVPGVGHRQEPGRVQALCPQATVERLNQPVVRGLSGPGEVDPHAVQVGPLV